MDSTSNGININNNCKTDQGYGATSPTKNEMFKFLNFPTIQDDLTIPTHPFLDACRSLIDFVSILGAVFIPVKSDIGGNVDKLTKIVTTNPTKFTSINSIIESEIGLSSIKQIGTDALLWLTRALQYMNMFLRLLVDDYNSGKTTNDLGEHFNIAYDSTLRKYHNWFVQNLVHLSLKAAPSRNSLINLLSPEINASGCINKEKEKCLYHEISDYRKLVEMNINSVHQLFDRLNIQY